jgi:hypothetical protein
MEAVSPVQKAKQKKEKEKEKDEEKEWTLHGP